MFENYNMLVCVKLSWKQLETVEDGVIETVMSTVLRLPEMNFRSVKFTKVTLHSAARRNTSHL